jgi:hypothetical protein
MHTGDMAPTVGTLFAELVEGPLPPMTSQRSEGSVARQEQSDLAKAGHLTQPEAHVVPTRDVLVHQTFIPSLNWPQVAEGGRGYGAQQNAFCKRQEAVVNRRRTRWMGASFRSGHYERPDLGLLAQGDSATVAPICNSTSATRALDVEQRGTNR